MGYLFMGIWIRIRILIILCLLIYHPYLLEDYRLHLSTLYHTICPTFLHIDPYLLWLIQNFSLFQLILLLLSLDSAVFKSFSLLPQLFFLLSFSHLFSLYYCLLADGIFRCPLNWMHIITILDSWLDFLIRIANSGSILNLVFLLDIYSFSWSSIICFTYSLNSFPTSVATL